ncbi:hypothetical protein [Mesorhizobium sp. M6A.T.Ce.TU.016.01.1.1]|uniref:hypothetical protein n=1 Tax=Mesorhizobium sp. M6A.T.Ce.TU.016.01.1.1 TaxID=2496783 RepID=UPI000FCBD214|nr:hypothetical protein [Mesorhizobium sp. M6A.T.Ce.TU.016.01.1.1]RUU30394.1 hypothetical protein EOC94_10895 [Mesorhizobium sp. M6A.T.Ce.TU.016.01.1.1]
MKTHTTAVTLSLLGATLASAAEKHPAPQAVVITAQCTTDATKGDGRRKACDSQVQFFTAPEGYVLAKETLTGGLKEANGSEKECRVTFSDNIEVIPGVPQPRKIRLQAHARSPHGHWSGRGWATCVHTIDMVPLSRDSRS